MISLWGLHSVQKRCRRSVLVRVQQRLHIDFCLSFFISWYGAETKTLPHVRFKTRQSSSTFTNSVTWFSLATCGVCHIRSLARSLWARGAHRGAHGASSNCSSPFYPLCLIAAEKNYFLPGRPIGSPQRLNTVKTADSVTSVIITLAWVVLPVGWS